MMMPPSQHHDGTVPLNFGVAEADSSDMALVEALSEEQDLLEALLEGEQQSAELNGPLVSSASSSSSTSSFAASAPVFPPVGSTDADFQYNATLGPLPLGPIIAPAGPCAIPPSYPELSVEELRRKRNREAATKSRAKRKQCMESMSAQVCELEAQVTDLATALTATRAEVTHLREQNQMLLGLLHRSAVCPQGSMSAGSASIWGGPPPPILPTTALHVHPYPTQQQVNGPRREATAGESSSLHLAGAATLCGVALLVTFTWPGASSSSSPSALSDMILDGSTHYLAHAATSSYSHHSHYGSGRVLLARASHGWHGVAWAGHAVNHTIDVLRHHVWAREVIMVALAVLLLVLVGMTVVSTRQESKVWAAPLQVHKRKSGVEQAKRRVLHKLRSISLGLHLVLPHTIRSAAVRRSSDRDE